MRETQHVTKCIQTIRCFLLCYDLLLLRHFSRRLRFCFMLLFLRNKRFVPKGPKWEKSYSRFANWPSGRMGLLFRRNKRSPSLVPLIIRRTRSVLVFPSETLGTNWDGDNHVTPLVRNASFILIRFRAHCS